MNSLKPRTIAYRRKRDHKTNYGKRLKRLLCAKLRLVVRKTGTRIIGQLVQFSPEGDKVLLAVDSIQLRKLGWNYSGKNLPAAYLTGILLGIKAREKHHTEAILDVGLQQPLAGGSLYAFLKGVIDAGLHVPASKESFPSEERLHGNHIRSYAESLQGKKSEYERRFAQYLKSKAEPTQISDQVEEIKTKLMKLGHKLENNL